MNTIKAIFSGGPANGQMLEIQDVPEYRFPLFPGISFENDVMVIDPVQVARYRKTGTLDEYLAEIYEFVGIE